MGYNKGGVKTEEDIGAQPRGKVAKLSWGAGSPGPHLPSTPQALNISPSRLWTQTPER
jgi:hypothetical protein